MTSTNEFCAGDKIQGYELLQLIGRGASASIWKAIDSTSQTVALKLLHREFLDSTQARERWRKEAQTLSQLSHPNIVRYLGDFVEETTNQPGIIMEWLEGSDLSDFKQTTRPSIFDSLNWIAQAADALAHAHEHNYLHLDIKPANLFLSGKDNEALVTLIDFGVGGVLDNDDNFGVVGTPAYMAPEQARKDAPLGTWSDIYSLGATLYELISGQAPHAAPTHLATLARLVTTKPARLRELNRDTPAAVDDWVAAMLELDPKQRPSDARFVATELRRLANSLNVPADIPPSESNWGFALGDSASRLVTTLVALNFESEQLRNRMLYRLRDNGVDGVPLGNRSLIGHLGAERSVGDEVKVALDLANKLARAGGSIGIATGRCQLLFNERNAQPVGEVVDRATALAKETKSGTILVDTNTCELGRGRYELKARNDGNALVGERLKRSQHEYYGGAPFVGRESEMSQMLEALERCQSDSSPIMMCVTGSPGIGKSRIRREFLASLSGKESPPRIIIHRAEAYGQKHSLGAASELMRNLLSIPKGLSVDETRVHSSNIENPKLKPIAEGMPIDELFTLSGLGAIKANDAQTIVRDIVWLWMTESIASLSKNDPVVLVLEDAQWADSDSIAWIEHLLRQVETGRLFILLLARPQFWEETGKSAFQNHRPIRLELGPLSTRATQALVTALLGQNGESVVSQLARQAAGHPLFAEELARLRAIGGNPHAAPTLEAAIRVSMDALSPECAEAVGRLSVFGLSAWDAGLEALGLSNAEELMEELNARDILVEQHATRFTGAREWHFKHALLRDVVYSSLSDAHRQELHGLAASFLAAMGEDTAVVAGHYESANDPVSAARYWHAAARRALAANSLNDALSLAERALAHAQTQDEGFARAATLDEIWSRLDPRAADRENALSALEEYAYNDATRLRARGSRARFDAARGGGDEVTAQLIEIRDEAEQAQVSEEFRRCTAELATRLAFAGEFERAEKEAKRLLEHLGDNQHPVLVDAWQTLAIVRQTRGDFQDALNARRQAVESARKSGLIEKESMLTTNLGFALATVGARRTARELLQTGFDLAEAVGSSGAQRHCKMLFLCWTSMYGSDQRLDLLLNQTREEADRSATSFWTAPARENLGTLYYRGCELIEEDDELKLIRGRNLLKIATSSYQHSNNLDVLPVAQGMWAHAEFKLGNDQEALKLASSAATMLAQGASSLLNEAPIYLTLAQVELRLGNEEAATNAIDEGIRYLIKRISALIGTPYASTFIRTVPKNAALVHLAESMGRLPHKLKELLL